MKGAKSRPQYISVKDLEKFQHYKDRCPPWVKLYYSLLDDPAFIALEEGDRHRYIICILIASRVGNRILNDPAYLARMMRVSEPVDLTPLIDCGLLLASRVQPASTSPASCEQVAPQSQRESQRERKERAKEEREGGVGGKSFAMQNGKGRPEDSGLSQLKTILKTIPLPDREEGNGHHHATPEIVIELWNSRPGLTHIPKNLRGSASLLNPLQARCLEHQDLKLWLKLLDAPELFTEPGSQKPIELQRLVEKRTFDVVVAGLEESSYVGQ